MTSSPAIGWNSAVIASFTKKMKKEKAYQANMLRINLCREKFLCVFACGLITFDLLSALFFFFVVILLTINIDDHCWTMS